MNNRPHPTGLLIALEGIDGAGKSTLAHALAVALRNEGHTVQLSREPTHGPWGRQLRESAASGRLDPAEERRLLLLDRREHVELLIAPALGRGEIVILDRYYLSMAAYQGAAGLDVDELVDENEAFAPKPDLVLLIDADPAVGLSRISTRGDAPNHFERADTLSACREIFLRLAHSPRFNARVIDANQGPERIRDLALSEIHALIATHSGRAI